jgi:hypothetical protein
MLFFKSAIFKFRSPTSLKSRGSEKKYIEEGRRQRAEGRRFNLEGDSNPS